jgi:hypothetical protein
VRVFTGDTRKGVGQQVGAHRSNRSGPGTEYSGAVAARVAALVRALTLTGLGDYRWRVKVEMCRLGAFYRPAGQHALSDAVADRGACAMLGTPQQQWLPRTMNAYEIRPPDGP